MNDTIVTMKLSVKNVNIVLDELNTCMEAHKQTSVRKSGVPAKEKQFHRQRVLELHSIIETIEG